MRHDPTQRREPDKGASPNNAPEPPHPSAPQGTDLTQGSIARHLATLAAPMMVGMIALFAFNLIDTWFVSQLGTEELAAISFTFPVVMIIGSLVMGIGVGTMSVLSRSIGASDTDRVRQLTADALLLGLGMVAVFSVVGVMTIDPVFTLLGAEGVILEHVHSYMSVWFMGMIFLVVPMIGMSVMRATGDTTTPAIIMGVAGVINALLDPLFIFGAGPIPALGLQGAAIATVISRATTLLVALYILVGRHNLVSFAAVPLRARLESWKQLMEVGLPAAASNIAVPLSGAVLTAMIASYGTHAIAAYGAASRLEMVVMLP
ncbi:MAG: MATE family efflux transporter, partial [Myxococcota bacterium]